MTELFSSTTAQLTSTYPELLGTDWADGDYFIVWDISAPAPRVKRLTKLEMFQILIDSVIGTNTFALIEHTHTAADITDFVEKAQDAAAAAILAGNPSNNGITATYDDAADSIVFNVTVGGTVINFVTASTDFKDSVLVATTANITLSGEQAIDGVTTNLSRVLVKDQTIGQQNGIWLTGPGAWARADDANTSALVTPGLLVLAEQGTTNANQIYILATAAPITLGTTVLTFLPTIVPSGFSVVTNWQQTTKTAAVADVNRWLLANNASAKTFTLPRQSAAQIGIGSEFYVQNMTATSVTFVAGTGATVRAPTGGLVMSTQYSIARVKKIGANEWTVSIVGGSSGSTVTNSATAPVAPTAGNLWFNTDTGELAVYYNDGDTSQWVVVSGGAGPTTLGTTAGGTGITSYTTGDIIYGSATNVLSKLAIGATNQVLTVVGGLPSWVYPFIPQRIVSAATTTVATDASGHLFHPAADTTARIWTIDSNANVPYPIGTAITFVNDVGAGVITIAITSDTLVLAGAGTTGSRTLAAAGCATALKMTATRWMISGTGLT